MPSPLRRCYLQVWRWNQKTVLLQNWLDNSWLQQTDGRRQETKYRRRCREWTALLTALWNLSAINLSPRRSFVAPLETTPTSARLSDCKQAPCAASVFLHSLRCLLIAVPFQAIVWKEAQAAWRWWERLCLCLRGKLAHPILCPRTIRVSRMCIVQQNHFANVMLERATWYEWKSYCTT